MSDAARQTVLGAIRHHLREAALRETLPPDRDALPQAPVSAAIDGTDARVTRFVERLSAVGGTAWRAGDLGAAVDAVGQILGEHGATSVAFSDAPLCERLREALGDRITVSDARDRAALFLVDAGISGAQFGVAETGSLVLESNAERHRLVSLVPPLHIALLPTERLLGTMADALAAVHTNGPAPTITFITGPSRTADIELTLVVGVHGPRQLHVVLVDSTG